MQVVLGAVDVSIDSLHIEFTGTGLGNASNGRGLDIRGVTRGKFGSVTLIDCGSTADNTSEALYVDSRSVDLQMNLVTCLDRRSGTSRCLSAANFTGVVQTNLQISSLQATNFQNTSFAGMANSVGNQITIDGRHASQSASATIPGGASTVVVTHNLINAPTVVQITGTSADTASAYAASINSATFTITVPAPVAADRTVYWAAGMAKQPDFLIAS
jgi:hypothetical protein